MNYVQPKKAKESQKAKNSQRYCVFGGWLWLFWLCLALHTPQKRGNVAREMRHACDLYKRIIASADSHHARVRTCARLA